MRERPLSYVPRPLLVILALALATQIAWHQQQPAPRASAENLPPVPTYTSMRLSAFGEPIALAKITMLGLQAYDYQPGVSLSFSALDYSRVRGWLGRVLELDPQGQYPLLAAARLYGEVPDPARKKMMMEFVYQRFFDDPNRRWESLAHCAILAKHRLHDLALAQRYAKAIREHALDTRVPAWAKQMEVFLLEDLNELQAASIVLGGILASRTVTDPQELHFLEEKLRELERKMQANK